MSNSKGYEGPRAIWADTEGFYGKPRDVPTVEFHVPKEQWDKPWVRADIVPPENIIAIHRPWHMHARYVEQEHPALIKEIMAGEYDDALGDREYGPAIRFIKHKYARM